MEERFTGRHLQTGGMMHKLTVLRNIVTAFVVASSENHCTPGVVGYPGRINQLSVAGEGGINLFASKSMGKDFYHA
jgi:hypothetical protein